MPKTRSGNDQEPSLPAEAGPSRKSARTKRRPRRPTEDPSLQKASQYVQELQALPTTKLGLELQCQSINARLAKIKKDHGLTGDLFGDEALSTLLQNVNELRGFGPHGKVGMHIRRETVQKLEEALSAPQEPLAEPEEDSAAQIFGQDTPDVETLPLSSVEADEDLTAESIQETFEGLDRDLLGVNSQAALDKISAFVTKTIVDNHPSKSRPQVTLQSSLSRPGTAAPSIPIIPSSIITNVKETPFKFAFLSVVATYDAKCAVSLQDLQAKVRTVTFDPTWFHSAVLTLPKSECRAAIFENGKFVITGVTTIKMALIATRNVLEVLKLCGCNPDISKRNFRAKNLTAMMELGVNIDIAGFAEKHQSNTYMDQDTFGAVTHFPEKSPSTIHKGGLGLCLLIFATGKIVLVGGKTEKHMISVFRDKTLGLLKPFTFGWT